jgi:hypothetical protein
MSICNHREFKGGKCCPLCYPKYPDYGGGIKGASIMTPTNKLGKPLIPIHHAKKNISNEFIGLNLIEWHSRFDETKWIKKFKGVRYY